MAISEAAQVFEDLGTLHRAAGVLERLGLGEESLALQQLVDQGLDNALDVGLDYQLDQEEVSSPEEELIEDAEGALEDAQDAIQQLEQVEQGEDLLQIEPPEAEALDVIPLMSARRKKLARRRRWICCGEVELRRTRKGKKIWTSECAYKRRDGSIGVMLRIVGRNPGKKPMSVILDGKRVQFTSEADIDRLLEESEAA